MAHDFMQRLGRLDEAVNTRRPVTPKHAQPSKVDRVKARLKEDAEDKRKLAAWAKAVKVHDDYQDRMTGQALERGTQPHPRRAEAHHHEPRANADTRYDVRNGICLSMETHEKVERGEIAIVGRHYFTVNGRRYLDVSKPVTFRRKKATP